MKTFDLAIIGAGPAGLTAAIYASRGGLQTVIFESGLIGGQIVLTSEVENYPGFAETMSGFDVIEGMRMQAIKFGTEFLEEHVSSITQVSTNGLSMFQIETLETTYEAKSVVYATGASPKKLGVPGEERLTGRGVSYCATCDGALYRGKTVAVIGGGDSAIEEGMFLTKFAEKVYIIHRRDQLRAVQTIQKRAFANEKLEFILDTIVEKINGDKKIESLTLLNKKTNQITELNVNGVFIYVGIIPNNELVKDILNLDESGFVITNDDMETNIKGLFVAGDIRKKTLRQVVTATSDGAIAGFLAERYCDMLM